MSDIRTSKTQTETYNTGLYLEDIVPVYSYDKVTVFYDEKGKKIRISKKSNEKID